MRAFWLAFSLLATQAQALALALDVSVEITGVPSIVFDSARDGCSSVDVPDINPRAFRDASGRIVMFALHHVAHPLRGPDIAHLTIDCRSALDSRDDPDPAHYNGRNFIAATWTGDGRTVSALVHEEYHADQFHRCRVTGDIGCWYNTILSYRSKNGGGSFAKTAPSIVAVAPFRQELGQGRHRGFFNPSNIVHDAGHYYALISTTGWSGQPFGNCLFRTDDPATAGSWRAFDGRAFSIRYDDPYKAATPRPKPCDVIGPFTFAVGSLVRHRASKTWIAITQASAGGVFPIDGFYYAVSRDLLHWGSPRLLVPGKTLYGDLCKAGASVIAYPALIDAHSTSRNFDDVGDHPDLLFTSAEVERCQTGQRLLVRQGVTIKVGRTP